MTGLAVAAAMAAAVWQAGPDERPLHRVVQDALIEHSASAPVLADAEAVLANACLAQRGIDPVLDRVERAASPFLDRGAGPEREPSPESGGSPAGLRALLGSEGAPQERVRDPDGRVWRAGTEGCLANARVQLYGSVREYLEVHAMGQWLLAVWQAELDRVLGTRSGRAALEIWRRCAARNDWPANVELRDAYRVAHLPLRSHQIEPWPGGRYCRVASGVMRAIDEQLRLELTEPVGPGIVRAFEHEVTAARRRAERAIRDGTS